MEAIGIITSIEPPSVIAGTSANKAKSYRKPARRLPNRQGSASNKPRLRRSIRSPTLALNYPRSRGSNHRSETNCQLRQYRPRRLSANSEPAPPVALVHSHRSSAPRWPDPSAVTSQGRPAVIQKRVSSAATLSMAPRLASNSAAAPVPAVAATAAGTLWQPTSHHQSSSIPMLLSAVAGVSALAVIVASIILKFGGAGRSRQPQIRRRRAANREWTDDDRIVISDQSDANLLPRRSGF